MDERLNKRLREIETILEKKRAFDRELTALLFPDGIEEAEEVAPVKKRGRKKKEMPEPSSFFDPEFYVSKCCRDRVVVRGGDEGTAHYECLGCGDACDIVSEDEPLPEKSKRKGRSFVEKECCGSKGPRHKGDCPGLGIRQEES